jgi:hypothetical protein
MFDPQGEIEFLEGSRASWGQTTISWSRRQAGSAGKGGLSPIQRPIQLAPR